MHKFCFISCVALLSLCLPLISSGQAVFSPLSHDGLTPSAFSIIYKNSLCIVSAKPYPPKDAGSWKWQSGETLNAKQAKLFRQPKTDVYVFGTPPAGTHIHLNYNAKFELLAGVLVQAIRPDGSATEAKLLVSPGINGTYRTDYGPVTLTAITDVEIAKPIPAGSPVVLAGGNQVIGSIVPARKRWAPYPETHQTNSFTFEVLCLPDSAQTSDLGPKNDALSFLGYPKMANAPKFRWILPDFIWEVQVGMPMADLASMRKPLKNNAEEVSDSASMVLRPDAPLFYKVSYHADPANSLLLGEINLYGEEVPRMGRLEKTTKLIDLLIGSLGSPALFSNTSLQPQGGYPEFILAWQSSGRTVMLRLKRDLDMHSRLHVSSHTTNSATSMLAKSQKFGPAPTNIREAFDQWFVAAKK